MFCLNKDLHRKIKAHLGEHLYNPTVRLTVTEALNERISFRIYQQKKTAIVLMQKCYKGKIHLMTYDVPT